MSNFSAKEPSLGYLYQIKYGLLLLLQKRQSNSVLKIECLDDIEIEDIDKNNLYQTKFHSKRRANLTNSSVDFWKTIRIWCQYVKSKDIDIEHTTLNLITTEEIGQNSILLMFKKDSLQPDEVDKIISELDKIANSSENKEIDKAIQEYLSLNNQQKIDLIQRIRIFDKSIDISDIDNKIKHELKYSCTPNQQDYFVNQLYGWWFIQCINVLKGNSRGIEFNRLESQISIIRDSLSQDNLPNFFAEPLEISDNEVEDYLDLMFVRQLSIINIKSSSKKAKCAISDYRRAYEQRSRLMRENILNIEEEDKYDKRLIDSWKNLFDIKNDIEEDSSSIDLVEQGKHFYLNNFATNTPQIFIRERFTEEYFTRGSYHILSNEKKVGWHPQFNMLL